MPQPLFYLGPEDFLEDDSVYDSADDSAEDSADADLRTKVSSVSDAETESQTESMTEAIQSSTADIVSKCGYVSHPFKVPPPTPVTSAASSPNGPAFVPSLEIPSESMPSFLRFYDYHDQNNDDHLPGLLADRETVIIGVLFHDSIEGLHGPLNLTDLATVLKFRNKRYDHWQSLTENMVFGAFVEMLGAYDEPNSTFKSWFLLYQKDPTGDSNDYFKELKAQLLRDLECAEQEPDEVENDCIFVKEESHPAGFIEDKERKWVSFGRPSFSIEDHEQNVRSVQRWIEDTA